MEPGLVNSLARHLRTLLENSSVPASKISATDRRKIQSLFDSGTIEEVRAGAGRRIRVVNQTALRAFALSLFPSGFVGVKGDIPPKGKAVAECRDSKKAIGKRPTIVLTRGFNGCGFYKNEKQLSVAEWTENAGVASLSLDSIEGWECLGTVGLVENLEIFWHIERIAPFVDLAVYTEGRIGADILQWLGSSGMADSKIIHFPDYDPVGMDEYLRITKACPERSSFFCPNDLETLFARFGKKQLIHDSSTILARLRKSTNKEVLYIVGLMDRFGVGLEQEVLLVDRHDA